MNLDFRALEDHDQLFELSLARVQWPALQFTSHNSGLHFWLTFKKCASQLVSLWLLSTYSVLGVVLGTGVQC